MAPLSEVVDLNIVTRILAPLSTIIEAEHEGVIETVQTLRRRKEEILQTIDWVDHFFETKSVWHLRKDEVLFAILEKTGGEAKTVVDRAVAEHEEFKEMYSQFKRQAEKLRAAGLYEFLDLCETMMRFLENHALMEDTILFPLANRVLSEEQMDEAIAKIRDIEKEQQQKMKRECEGKKSKL